MKTTSIRQGDRHFKPRALARAAALVIALCALAFANFAMAQSNSLNATGNWTDGTKWSLGVPTSAHTAQIHYWRTATVDNGTEQAPNLVGGMNIASGYVPNASTVGTLSVAADGFLEVSGSVTVATAGGSSAKSGTGYVNVLDGGTMTVGGSVYLGNDGNGPAYGYLTVNGSMTTGGLAVGNSARWGGSTYGYVTIGDGGTLTVTGATTIATASYTSGSVNIDVGDWASGLTIGTSLSVGNGVINITFTENPTWSILGTVDDHKGIHYGLMWAGDHVATLTALGGKLTWDDTTHLTGDLNNAASIFYDIGTDATYVGFYIIPEPASLALLGLGAAWLLNRRRGRKA